MAVACAVVFCGTGSASAGPVTGPATAAVTGAARSAGTVPVAGFVVSHVLAPAAERVLSTVVPHLPV
ncbi:hypothetical protein GCM10010174_03860 [Kutzneria viridogrisea]